MKRLLIALIFTSIASVVLTDELCSVDDEASICLWKLLKALGRQDRWPKYLRNALSDAYYDDFLSGQCGQSIPSQGTICALQRAVDNKVIPSCVVDIVKSIRPCPATTKPTTLKTQVPTTTPAVTIEEIATTEPTQASTSTPGPSPPVTTTLEPTQASTSTPGPSPPVTTTLEPTQASTSTPGPSPPVTTTLEPTQASTSTPGPSPPVTTTLEPTQASTSTPGPSHPVTTTLEPTQASTSTPGPSPPVTTTLEPTQASTSTPGPSPPVTTTLEPTQASTSTPGPSPPVTTTLEPTQASTSTPGPSPPVTTTLEPTQASTSTPGPSPPVTTTLEPTQASTLTTGPSPPVTTTQTQKRAVCDPPDCAALQDEKTLYPSADPYGYYTCKLFVFGGWQYKAVSCPDGLVFDYFAQNCVGSEYIVENVCDDETLPPLPTLPHAPTTTQQPTTVPVTQAPTSPESTQPPPSTPAPIPSTTTISEPQPPTTTSLPTQQRSVCDPPDCAALQDLNTLYPSAYPYGYYYCTASASGVWQAEAGKCTDGLRFAYVVQSCVGSDYIVEDVCDDETLPPLSTGGLQTKSTIPPTPQQTVQSTTSPPNTPQPTVQSTSSLPTTMLPTTQQKSVCDPPDCNALRDPRTRFPSQNAYQYYTCVPSDQDSTWIYVTGECPIHLFFRYQAQACVNEGYNFEDLCDLETLPELTTAATSGQTEVTSTVPDSTQPPPSTPVPTPSATTISESQPPTTTSLPTQKRSVCDPPDCAALQDEKTLYPSADPYGYYTCIGSYAGGWQNKAVSCPDGLVFDYFAQSCVGSEYIVEDVCDDETLPPLPTTPPQAPTTTRPLTQQPTTAPVTQPPTSPETTQAPPSTPAPTPSATTISEPQQSTTTSQPTQTQKRSACDPPDCPALDDEYTVFPSADPNGFYTCIIDDAGVWHVTPGKCPDGLVFDYFAQNCNRSEFIIDDDICDYETLPPLTTAGPQTTTPVPVTQSPTTTPVPVTQSPTTTPVPVTQSPTTTPVSVTQAPSTAPTQSSVCDPPDCNTLKDPNTNYPAFDSNIYYYCYESQDGRWFYNTGGCTPGAYFNYWKQRCESAQPTENICTYSSLPQLSSETTPAPAQTTTIPTTPQPTTSSSTTIPSTTEQPSTGPQRIYYVPFEFIRIFKENLPNATKDEYEVLFKAYSQLIERVSSGLKDPQWVPDYLPAYLFDIWAKIQSATLTGNDQKDFDFTYPQYVAMFIQQFKGQGVIVPWEVIKKWMDAYAREFTNYYTADQLKTFLQELLNQVVSYGGIPASDVEKYSTDSIIQQLITGATSERQQTGLKYKGPNEDYVNPLIQKYGGPVGDRIAQTHGELDAAYRAGTDLTDYVPPTLSEDLDKLGISSQGKTDALNAYALIKERFIQKVGNKAN